MNIYKFYISIPEDLNKVTKEDARRYINVSSNISSNSFIYDSENKRKIYLYAFTNNKEYSKIFEELHDMRMFKKIKNKITKDEYLEFRKEITEKELVKVDIEEFDEEYGKISVICPKFEVMDIEDTTEYYQNDKMINTATSDYRILEEEYVKLLDGIGYCNFCMSQMGDEMSDYVSYNESYGISAEGYTTYRGLKYNKFKIYLLLFEFILNKECAA